jgi:hypothetical protein
MHGEILPLLFSTSKMRKFLKKLFVGTMKNPHKYVHLAIENQWKNIHTIWSHETSPTFGIERLFRLFLALTAYLFPGIYIRHFSGKHGLLCRKLALDCFVTIKLLLPVAILKFHLQKYLFAQILVSYLGIETLLYILSLLFLSDIYKPPISNKRSYLMLVMNYVEICLDFAVLYGGLGLVANASTSIDAVFFSFVTAFTVGYGDMVPNSRGSRVGNSPVSLFSDFHHFGIHKSRCGI